MRFLFLLTLLMCPLLNYADDIKCYSQGKLIYSGQGDQVTFDDDILIFNEIKSNHTLIILGDCVIKSKY